MPTTVAEESLLSPRVWFKDLVAGVVVFLVALPLCLGIALASGAPLFSGVLAGIVGGLVVGALSGSHTSVSGPAAGLTAIVAMQIAELGSFQAFLLAVVIGGVIQIGLGLAKAGFIAAFFPSSVIKGLLTAIGLILIIKQTPYVLGLVKVQDPDIALQQMTPSHPSIITEIGSMFAGELSGGALAIGMGSMALLILWDKVSWLKKSLIPAPLVVVALGILAKLGLRQMGDEWRLGDARLVRVPVAEDAADVVGFLMFPDFSQLDNPAVYIAGLTIAIVASLETLLNLEAIDNLDPKRRVSPASRELLAQGVGNVTSGLIGGLPITSVIVRGTVNIGAGAKTKLSAIFHGGYLLAAVVFLPELLNLIPLSSLAAILLMTGFKLASPKLVKQLWGEGRYQFLPYLFTVLAIVATDLLIGIMIGLVVALAFILYSNYQRPLQMVIEKHLGGELHHLQLANQVSFLNRAALDKTLNSIPSGAHALIDARSTAYIDPDILSLIKDYKNKTAPARGVEVSLRGFRPVYEMKDEIQFVDLSTRELQQSLTPAKVLRVLREGNDRFRNQHPLPRDLARQVNATAQGQYPIALVLSCMDSRTPTELIFDLGLGDVLNVCLAGNVMVGPRVLASVEYGCVTAGAKLVVVMAHTGSTVMRAVVEQACAPEPGGPYPHGEHFGYLVDTVGESIDEQDRRRFATLSESEREAFYDEVARRHILHSIDVIRSRSRTVTDLLEQHKIGMIAAVYDIRSGRIEFINDSAIGFDPNAD
ncbi:MAG: sulfate transporter [Planctomycetaceae bacterium]|nr:MAG: sulfate transporter [Planctomycetaceae bacterium]